ncbi:hypothetical protein [Actinomadura sp. NTSP31]|uniref:hypothetical protein n=1 Tax=Actinomadura sp. NTSP31 TaxID=1735447 RepID=UPI0035BEE4CB
MARQISFGSTDPSTRALECRVATLERRVAALAEALQVMAMALETAPLVPYDDGQATALRQARELLLPQSTDCP